MIEINNLTKIFKSKKNEVVKALDDVSFNLPNSGFVFIVGKSGSGKTTLLNMISKVDSFNSGEIIFNGIKLSKLKGKELDYYRNENIGFIFQDYQLLDELTVFQNVKLALNFLNDNDDNKVMEAINSVGLSGFENRYPNELSGGEKQRVAIARAIVKNPKLILADEPTGNLDTITSLEILNILNEISKTKLVLIVTHNIFDAHEFAKYILELSYGKLIGTYIRNEEVNKTLEVKDKVLRLPLHKELIESEKDEIIKDINNGIEDIIQDDLDFIPCELINNEEVTEIHLKKEHISFSNSFKLGKAFLRRSMMTIITFSLIIAGLFGIIYSSEIIVTTKTIDSLNETKLNYDRPLINIADGLMPRYIGKSALFYNFVDKDDIKLIKQKGYNGKIYPSLSLFNLNQNETIDSTYSSGLKIADQEYFLNYVEKVDFHFENEVYDKTGVYLTDYVIDIFNLNNPILKINYDDTLRMGKWFNIHHVNGVINTHYKEKYNDIYTLLLDYFKENKNVRIFDKINKKRLDDFIYDLNFYRSFYTFEKDFVDIMLESNTLLYYAYSSNSYKYKDKIYLPQYNTFCYGNFGFNAIGRYEYEALTGKTLSFTDREFHKLDEPITIDVEFPTSDLIKKDAKSVGITFTHTYNDNAIGYSSMVVDRSNKELCKKLMPVNSITLENNKELKNIFKNNNLKNLYLLDFSFNILKTHKRLDAVFNKIFKLVIGLLFIASLVALVFYSIYIVKKNERNIGILKSLGGRSKDILTSLSINIIITAVFCSLLSIIFSNLFLLIIEKILLSSFKLATLEFSNYYNVNYLVNNYHLLLINALVIIGLLIFTLVIIFIRLNKYKPTELIKGAK